MRLLLAIVICKISRYIGKLVGKGSSLPGKIALKIYPGAMRRLKLPGIIIAVTGSNGKSSTAEMIAHALASVGMNIGWNREGSNQTEGVATLLLRSATLGGRVKCDALVLECDERYARAIFSQVKPTVLLVTNLCRDQLSRNGHHEFIQECLSDAISIACDAVSIACDGMSETSDGTTLVLNADDPYVAVLARTGEAKAKNSDGDNSGIVWYGIGENAVTEQYRAGVYDDGAFCPLCKARMEYEYRVTTHFGSFRCMECGLARAKPSIEVISIDYKSGEAAVSGNITMKLENPSTNSAYNTVAAIATVSAAGIDAQKTALALDGYELKSGRTMTLTVGSRRAMLLISKHENSLAYNRSLALVVGKRKPCTVIILVDSISRKYYTSETSWLWDIDFDILSDDCVKKIILAGRYSNELMMRFAMSSVDMDKCRPVEEVSALRSIIEECGTEAVYVITCFADKAKVLKECGV